MSASSDSSNNSYAEHYHYDTLRREITQTTKQFALCFCTFVTKTYIESVLYEKVNLSKINVSTSSSDSSSSSYHESSGSSTDELRSQLDHKNIESKIEGIVYSRTNSSTTLTLISGTCLEPGDYTIGVIFKNEADTKELYALQMKVKYLTISNFAISQMLTQMFRSFGYSPSQMLHLPQKSDGEFTPVFTKIRNDIAGLSKVIKSNPVPVTVPTTVPATVPAATTSLYNLNQYIPIPIPGPGYGPISGSGSGPGPNLSTVSTDVSPTQNNILNETKLMSEFDIVKQKLGTLDEKCAETNYFVKENLNKTQYDELLKQHAQLIKQLQVIENKLSSHNEVVHTIPEISKIMSENKILVEKLSTAEDYIEVLEKASEK